MFSRDSQCNKNVRCCAGSCDGDFCKDDGICQPNEDWIKKNCLIPIQSGKEFPKECICGNSDKKSAIINIFIHNDTSDILELIEKKIINGTLSVLDCDENSVNCSSIISYRLHSCKNDNGSCGRGLLVYPSGPNNTTQGKFPDKINPKSVVFIRAYSGEKGDPECGCKFDFSTFLRYGILNDPDSSVQIQTCRFRNKGCTEFKGDVIHHFDPLVYTNSGHCNSGVETTGLLSAVGTIVGDATYSVVIKGGTSNNNDCSNICPKGTFCYKGQCMPEVSCTSSTDCNLDYYCGPKNICIPGCTQTSYNCKPGTTCANGTCSSSSNGGESRRRMELIVVFGVVFFIIIVMGVIYFIYARNE